jgi:RNA methyltransferase, TrmH family
MSGTPSTLRITGQAQQKFERRDAICTAADMPETTFMVIASLNNPRVKAASALSQKKHRYAAGGLFLLEGAAHVAGASEAGFDVVELWHSGLPPPAVAARSTIEASPDVLGKISGKDNPQDVVGVLRQRWAELPDRLTGLWLALDRPRDPGNLGTIIRTADACAVAGIILIGEATDPYAPECVRATSGSIANVPLTRCSEAGFVAWVGHGMARREVVGTSGEAKLNYREHMVGRNGVVLMGSESDGLTAPLAGACARLVRIPMWGRTESLNLAVATGVMLYEAMRGR